MMMMRIILLIRAHPFSIHLTSPIFWSYVEFKPVIKLHNDQLIIMVVRILYKPGALPAA